MKLLTKEEESAHYRATLQGGVLGGLGGLALGTLAVVGAARRYSAFNSLTLQMKAFLITSSGTFAGIIAADHASRAYEAERNPADQALASRDQQKRQAELSHMTWTQRAMDWGRRERYKIVGASWVASMGAAFAIVGRSPYLTGTQKLVQARVYAQGLTLAVLIASATFELQDSRQGAGKYETVEYVDDHQQKRTKQVEREQPSDGDPLWKDMVRDEEERLRERDTAIRRMEERDHQRRATPKQHHPAKKSTRPAQQSDREEGQDDDKQNESGDSEAEAEDEEEDDDDDEPHPIPGKKGEGKMMAKATDQPEPGTSAVP